MHVPSQNVQKMFLHMSVPDKFLKNESDPFISAEYKADSKPAF